MGPRLKKVLFWSQSLIKEASCPAGIVGAWGTTSEKDHSFSIECHSDQVHDQSIQIIQNCLQVKIDCCKTITLKADPNGRIATHQGGVLGDYTKVEQKTNKRKKKQSNKKDQVGEYRNVKNISCSQS